MRFAASGQIVAYTDAALDYSALGFNADSIIDSGPDALLAAEIPLGSLN